MTLQEFIDFDKYRRCFHVRQDGFMPVAYDPKERRYLVDHKYLSAELGSRIVSDAPNNQPKRWDTKLNTIEFAVKARVPYAIDFLNPAPDFERDRHY